MRTTRSRDDDSHPRRLCRRGCAHVRAGLSLLELLVVLAILVALAGIAVMSSANVTAKAQVDATNATLRELRDTFVGNASGPGYRSDVGRAYDDDPAVAVDEYRRSMTFLFTMPMNDADVAAFDPVTKRGWRGPYLKGAPRDGWGTLIELQTPAVPTPAADQELAKRHARLVSAGPNGVIDTPDSWLGPTNPPVTDDVVVFLEVSE